MEVTLMELSDLTEEQYGEGDFIPCICFVDE